MNGYNWLFSCFAYIENQCVMKVVGVIDNTGQLRQQ